jgi:hypothetical protein
MYPQRELTLLADRKALLRRDIALRRAECAEAAARVARPIKWLGRMLVLWRQLSPFAQFAAVPLGLLVQRTVFPRSRLLGMLLRWSPLAFGAVRAVCRTVKSPGRPARSSNGQFAHPPS